MVTGFPVFEFEFQFRRVMSKVSINKVCAHGRMTFYPPDIKMLTWLNINNERRLWVRIDRVVIVCFAPSEKDEMGLIG